MITLGRRLCAALGGDRDRRRLPRLLAGGWLVRRSVTTRDAPDLERVEYHCSDQMPR